jgi:DNA-binding CsgD family transcriptional regulator
VLSPVKGASALLERDRELAALASAVAALGAGAGGAILIEGAAGTGKSRLLAELVQAGRRAGHATGAVRAVDLDAALPFAVVRRLLKATLLDAASRLPGDPRPEHALRALAGSAQGSAAPLAERGTATVHAVVDGAEAAVDALGPLVLAVDDLQWADAPSLELLGYLAERARDLPILLGVALRAGEVEHGVRTASDGTAAPPGNLGAVAARLRAAPGVTVLAPTDFSADAVAALVRRRLPSASPEVLAACGRVTGGNPFLLTELLDAVAAADILAADDAAERIERLTPRTVADGVLVRLGRLTNEAGALARAVSVLADGARLHEAARLAGLDPEVAAAAADALVRVDILDSGDPLAFRHPLIAAAVRHDLGEHTRAELHRRAADLLAADGKRERSAAHLLHAAATADPTVVDRLRAAAATASERGDAHTARRLLRRALDEPAAPPVRPHVLAELARAEVALGDPGALAHMDEAIANLRDGQRAAAVLRGLARLHYMRSDFATAARLAEQALDRAGSDAPSRTRLRATWLLTASLNPETAQATGAAVDDLVAQTEAGSPPGDPELQAVVAVRMMAHYGDPETAAALALAAVDGEIRLNDDGLGLGFDYALATLCRTGTMETLRSAAARALEWARDRGSMMAAANAALYRGQARLELGDLDGAEADAELALVPWTYGWVGNTQEAYALLARARLERGDGAGAQAAIDAAAAIETPHPPYVHAAGRVLLAEGDAAGALAAFERAGEMLHAVWGVDSPMVLPWRGWGAVATSAAGRAEDAARLAAEELELAGRTRVPAVVAFAQRAQGLVAGGERGVDLLRAAHDTLADTDRVLETIRTQVELGAALRRAGRRREAREQLAAARDRADRLGLPALAARAEEEQRASGGRPRRTRLSGAASLTPSERRIAERAAAGASNRQIAAELFLTGKTVEWHLRNVFRKLDISSRADLADALADGGG